MAQIIDIPGQGEVEFPDSMSDADIVAAIKKLSAPKERKPLLPKQEMSMMERVASALPSGLTRGDSTVRGLVQGAADPSVGLFQLGANAAGLGDGVNEAIRKQNKDYEAKRGDDGFDVSRLIGNILSPVNILGGKAVGIPGTAGGRAKVAAAMGGAGGLSTPITEGDVDQKRLENTAMGVALGPLLSGSMDLGAKGLKFARNAIDSLLPGGVERSASRVANEAAGSRRDAIIQALSKAQPEVPGVRLTAGQASTPAGSAEFAALQKIAERVKPSEYADIDAANQAARRAAIQSIGGDKEALAEAIGRRAGQAKVDYEAAFNASVKADPELASLMSNPYIKDALPSAFKIAKAKEISPKTDMTEFLQGVKLSLDDKLQKAGEGALGNTEKKLVAEAKSDLVKWLGSRNMLYDKARTNFAEASKPINQMEVGQFLENKLVNALDSERAGAFAQAMRDAPGTIKRSTGNARFDDLSQVLTPQQKKVAESVLSNLQNEAQFSDLAKRGQQAASGIVGEAANPIPQLNFLNQVATVVNAVTRRLEGKASKETINLLADAMQDPRKMADLMQKTSPQNRAVIREVLTQYGMMPAGMQGE